MPTAVLAALQAKRIAIRRPTCRGEARSAVAQKAGERIARLISASTAPEIGELVWGWRTEAASQALAAAAQGTARKGLTPGGRRPDSTTTPQASRGRVNT